MGKKHIAEVEVAVVTLYNTVIDSKQNCELYLQRPDYGQEQTRNPKCLITKMCIVRLSLHTPCKVLFIMN